MTPPGPVLHGRSEALRALRAALEGAEAGRGRLALVSGEAGIGKSALVEAIAVEAGASGADATWGRAWEFADAPPLFPLWSCLRAIGIPVVDGARGDADGADMFQLWERVLSALALASKERTQVWILEDLHAADLGTLDLLTFLAPLVRATRVLLLATVRTHELDDTSRAGRRLARMARDGLEVRLHGLCADDVARVAEAQLGRTLDAAARRAIVEQSGGNPLFVVECVRALEAGQGARAAALAPTVSHLVAERVSRLPEPTRDQLARGAILGREFAAATLARMQGSLPAPVIDALSPALRSGLLREPSPGMFVFSHALVRDAIEGSLRSEARAAHHAGAFDAMAALEETQDVLVERARHALLAMRPDRATETTAVVARAAALLEREGAPDRALELLLRVEEARAAGLVPPASLADRLRTAEIARNAGRTDVTRRVAEQIMSAAREVDDGAAFARAALLHASDVRPGVIDRPQLAFLQEARRRLGAGDPPLLARLLARTATALQPAEDQADPQALARDAIAMARALGDAATTLDVLELAHWGLYFAPLEERIAMAEQALELATRIGDRRHALGATEWLATYALERGDACVFAALSRRALDLSDDLGHPCHRWRSLLLSSCHALATGDFATSERAVTEVMQLGGLIDDRSFWTIVRVHRAVAAALQGRTAAALVEIEGLAETLDSFVEPEVLLTTLRALVHAGARDATAARAELDLLDVPGRAARARHLGEWSELALLGDACAIAGTDPERRAVLETLDHSGVEDLVVFGYAHHGTMDRVIGVLAASLGDLERAEVLLRAARARARERGHRPWIAKTALDLGRVLERRGRLQDAGALREEARAIAVELGMEPPEVPARPATASPRIEMAREGALYRVAAGERVARVRDSRGVSLLARLVERPHEELHVLTLATDEAEALPESSAGEALDEQARTAYRRRVEELGAAIQRAGERGERERVARLQAEKAAIARELSRGVGLGGRPRQVGSATERARINVQKRLKEAITRVAEADPVLGAALLGTVRTGTYCSYRP